MNASNAFCLDFPQPARLSPGMRAALRVVFRPLRAQPYSDAVMLLADGCLVDVPLSAPLARGRLSAPPGLDFGVAPACERAERALPICNAGAAPLTFAWRVDAPFSVAPPCGALAPGERVVCTAAFEPRDAAAYSGSAACQLDGGEVVAVEVRRLRRPRARHASSSIVPAAAAAAARRLYGACGRL